MFTQEGLKKLNDITTKHFQWSSSHRDEDALKQVLEKRNRIENLEDSGHSRMKQILKCSKCNEPGHNKRSCSQVHHQMWLFLQQTFVHHAYYRISHVENNNINRLFISFCVITFKPMRNQTPVLLHITVCQSSQLVNNTISTLCLLCFVFVSNF